MKIRFKQLFLISVIGLISCNGASDSRNPDISDVKIENIKLHRYEQALFNIDKSKLKQELERLQPDFPMFLDGDLSDSANLKRIYDYLSDTMLVSVYKDCQVKYPNLTALESELTQAFRHLKYFYSERNLPDVYTYVSGFDYEYPVQYYDGHLLVALDMYLGVDYPRYRKLGLANYILRRFTSEYLARDCMMAIAQSQTDNRKVGSALLDKMIDEGKKLWFVSAMMPDLSYSVLFDYTPEQLDWATNGESIVWAFLIENEMLYSTEMQHSQKLISDGPFTSYFGAESPPRLGMFIGYKIVSSYMERNKEIYISQLMSNYSAQEILNRSGYKPKV
jgi:hypothetical protein